VETAARSVTGVIHRIGYGRSTFHLRFEFLQPLRISVLSRRDAHDVFERALEMMRADTRLCAQRLERLRLFIVFGDCVTDLAHKLNFRIIRAGAARVTTTARAKALAFGGFGKLKETDLLGPRPPSRTRRTTIDSRRLYREYKAAIAR